MSAVPAARPRVKARPQTRRRAGAARFDRGSVVLIAICALLMAGIVTVQVAVLRLNGDRGRLQQQLEDLKSGNASLANASAGGDRITAARARALELRMVQLPIDDTKYLPRAR